MKQWLYRHSSWPSNQWTMHAERPEVDAFYSGESTVIECDVGDTLHGREGPAERAEDDEAHQQSIDAQVEAMWKWVSVGELAKWLLNALDDIERAELELNVEIHRADLEGWLNDPTGSSHIASMSALIREMRIKSLDYRRKLREALA